MSKNNDRFISNMYDPEREDAIDKTVHPNFGDRRHLKKRGEDEPEIMSGPLNETCSREEALSIVKRWVKTKVIGPAIAPKDCPHTSEELKEMGYVGLYRPYEGV